MTAVIPMPVKPVQLPKAAGGGAAAESRALMIRALAVILEPGQTTELRIPEARASLYSSFRSTASGYFTDLGALADAVAAYAGLAEGIYITLNPVKSDLLARSSNRVTERAKHATQDSDIVRRRWIFVDIDPLRTSGICATDEERAAALELQQRIRVVLLAEDWPEPVQMCSGSGAYLLWRVDLPAEDGGLSARVSAALAARFNTEAVQIDPTTCNPARIARVPWTMNCKGDDSVETGRRHRLATMDPIPIVPPVPVSTELLEALIEEWAPPVIGPGPGAVPKASGSVGGNGNGSHPPRLAGSAFDLGAWLARHAVPVGPPTPYGQGGRRWLFSSVCPWDASHKGREVHVVQMASGAISAGCQHRSCPGSRHSGNRWHELRALYEPGWQPRAPEYVPPGAVAEQKTPLRFECNDIGNGKRLVHWHGENLRFAHEWKKWLTWDGTRWVTDSTAEVVRMAKDARRLIYSEIQLVTGTEKDDEAARQAIAKHAAASASARSVDAMIKLAASEMAVPVLVKDMDADPWALTCKNGMLDLRTGELRPHSRDALSTKIAPVAFSPVAKAPTWIAFLRRIMGWNDDEERASRLISFLQRAVGYSLTGSVSENCLFLLYGTGRNGKGTFVETVRAVLGDYAQNAEFSTFVEKKNDAVRNDIARLRGSRLVSASESKEGKRFDEDLIKTLTGQDMVTARFLYAELFEFMPAFKLFLAANHKPVIRGTDEGIWSRIRLIPFTVFIPASERDPCLKEKLRAELQGILRWAVDGCLEWQRQGLNTPVEVESATGDYRKEMDTLAEFLADCCVVDKEATVPAGELYAAYTDWASHSGERPMSQKSLGGRLSDRGFERYHSGRKWWRGIGLAEKTGRIPREA